MRKTILITISKDELQEIIIDSVNACLNNRLKKTDTKKEAYIRKVTELTRIIRPIIELVKLVCEWFGGSGD